MPEVAHGGRVDELVAFRVWTRSGSVYQVEVGVSGRGRLLRVPDVDGVDLYGDAGWVECRVVELRVGFRAAFVFVRDPVAREPGYVFTTRWTTEVMRIEAPDGERWGFSWIR